MTQRSEDSVNDYDRFGDHSHHAHCNSTPQPEQNEGAESTLAGVGGRFGYRRESYPRDLEFSEGEDTVGQPSSSSQAERAHYASDTVPRGLPLGSLPTTPTPSGPPYSVYVRTSSLPPAHERHTRRTPRRPRPSHGNRSLSTENTFARMPPHTNSTFDARNENNDDNERGRSATPTPNFPHPRTPSPSSEETAEESVEDHDEGREPISPYPYSAYYPYDPNRANTEINGFEQRYRS